MKKKKDSIKRFATTFSLHERMSRICAKYLQELSLITNQSRTGKRGKRGEGGGEQALIVKSRSMTDAATAERVRDHRRTLIREKRNEVAGERG